MHSIQSTNTTKPYLSKREIAAYVGVSCRTIEDWTSRRIIPVIRVTDRKNLYHVGRCEAALQRYEIKEAGRKEVNHARADD